MLDILLHFTGKYLIFIMLLIVPWYWYKKRQSIALHIVSAVILAEAVAQAIKHIFPTLRPFQVMGAERPSIFFGSSGVGVDSAFPSGHAAMSFALATSVYLNNKKQSVWFYLGAVLISTSRILVGAHFVKDIAGGAVIGVGCAFIVNHLIILWNPAHKKK